LGANAKNDGDLLSGHLNLLDQGANNLAAQVPVGVSQPSPYLDGKLIEPTDQQMQVVCRVRLAVFLLQELFQGRNALTQACQARFELGFANEALGIGVNEAAESLAQLGELSGSGAAIGLGGAIADALGPPSIFGRQPRGVFEHGAHLRPDRRLDGRSGQRGRMTQWFAALRAQAWRIPSATAVVGALLRSPILGPVGDSGTGDGIATIPTH
jgi:hypothetical protein